MDMSWRGVSDFNVEGNGWLREVRSSVVYVAGSVLAFIEQTLGVQRLVKIWERPSQWIGKFERKIPHQ